MAVRLILRACLSLRPSYPPIPSPFSPTFLSNNPNQQQHVHAHEASFDGLPQGLGSSLGLVSPTAPRARACREPPSRGRADNLSLHSADTHLLSATRRAARRTERSVDLDLFLCSRSKADSLRPFVSSPSSSCTPAPTPRLLFNSLVDKAFTDHEVIMDFLQTRRARRRRVWCVPSSSFLQKDVCRTHANPLHAHLRPCHQTATPFTLTQTSTGS